MTPRRTSRTEFDRAAAGAVQRLQPAVALQVPERPAGLLDRAGDPPRADVARHLLPRRRPDRLRRPGQPVPVDGRRHEPVPVGGLRAARRSGDPQSRVRRAADVGQHERPARQAPAHPRPRERRRTPSRQGNLFRQGQAQTRPEIYAMGFRNPFRFAVNRENGDVYVGDYSPDAQVADPARGPEGIGRWMIVRRPANFGWPFCITPDKPYVDYDFTPDAPQSGEEFNCNAPTNDSRNNTGLRRLPAVVLAGRLVLVQHGPGSVPGAVQPHGARVAAATASGRWAGRRCSSTAASSRRSGGRACSRGIRSSTSGRGTTRRSSS